MMKTHLFIKSLSGKIYTAIFVALLLPSLASAQGNSCACKASINVSLGTDGTAAVTPEMVLASNSTCPGPQNVILSLTPSGPPMQGSPVVDCDDIGKTIYARVTNGTNTCWGTVKVEDKLKPIITPPTGLLEISCIEMVNFQPPFVFENCGPYTLNIVNETITPCTPNQPYYVKTVTRTYTATDAAGNVSDPVAFTINVLVSDLEGDLDFPGPWSMATGNALQCKKPSPDYAVIPSGPFAGNPSPIAIGSKPGTGVPSLEGTPLFPNPPSMCNLAVSYSDITLFADGCVTKIMRSWHIYEWSCQNPQNHYDEPQLIEIVDNQGPSITAPSDFTVTTGAHTCEATFIFPGATVSDNCTATNSIDVDIAYPGGFIDNTNGGSATLPVGVHTITYTAYDDCLRSSATTMTVTVEDRTPPVTVCDDLTTVAVSNDCEAWVPATAFDDGSYDECQLAKLLVRRMPNGTTSTSCLPCDIPAFPGFDYLGTFGDGANKRYYYLSKHLATAPIALRTGKAMGGYAVSWETSGERNALVDMLNDKQFNGKLWIGLTDLKKEENFVWESGVQAINPGVVSNTADKDYFLTAIEEDEFQGIFGEYQNREYRYIVEITDPCGWNSHVKFCSKDVAATAPNRMIQIRAIDKSGNHNECMVTVVVQDKIGPTITCPPTAEVYCDDSFDLSNLAAYFGIATADDNCENPLVQELPATNTLNACRIGTITRNFRVTDAGGRTAECQQHIHVDPREAFNEDDITWPSDQPAIVGCADPTLPQFAPSQTGRPTFRNDICALVGSDYTDQIFSFNNPTGAACFKILRTWTVIDWCQRNEDGTYETWSHTQTIMVSDLTKPTITSNHSAPITVNTFDADCEDGFVTLVSTATDNCTTVANIASRYRIDEFNDGSWGSWRAGTGGNINASANYKIGTHRIEYTFEDRCGNVTTTSQLFSVINRKAPVPQCINGLSVNLTPMDTNGDGTPDTGMAIIKATDVNNNSTHDCYDNLIFSFTPVTFNIQTGAIGMTSERMFTCAQIGDQPLNLYVAVITPAGDVNQAFCSTFISVQDNNTPTICTGNLVGNSVSGKIETEQSETVELVDVRLQGAELEFKTDASGEYIFSEVNKGGDYKVLPSRNDDVLNGVSTLDLVLIQKHVLGMENLASPYKLIAADINKDTKINATDLVELRKVILGVQDKFQNNNSWRFVDNSYKFADPTNAHQELFSEIYNITNLDTDMAVDFTAVKVGDVNQNAKANAASQNVEARNGSALSLHAPGKTFAEGDVISVPVLISHKAMIEGMQFTASFDPAMLEMIQVSEALIKAENIGLTYLSNGKITVSWNSQQAVELKEGDELFTITFQAKKTGSLSESFQINSDVTRAEAYPITLDIMNINFQILGKSLSGEFVLYQNTPNPFNEFTSISFELPKSEEAMLTIYDMNGREIKNWKNSVEAGYHTVNIQKSELGGSGMFYYTLQAGTYTATKKMVLID